MPSRYPFTKKQRLLVRIDFDRVFKEGIFVKSQYVTIVASGFSSLSPRLGMIITKKNVSRSVDRNRIKRVVRESFRLNRNPLPREIVVIAHKGSGQLSSVALRHVLEQLWVKLLSKMGRNFLSSSSNGIKTI